mmetsp:Transcript_25253/g.35265  ORF Transcript_25253/g.35265 Transcript_25253/m.35265 type:complete len:168 (+) Transcript_25253:422-925(+)
MKNKTMPRPTQKRLQPKLEKETSSLKSNKLQLRSLDDERKKSKEWKQLPSKNQIIFGGSHDLDIRVTPMQQTLPLEELRKLYTKLAQTRMHWEKNEHVPECHICLRAFSLFFRRHHCRICGRIFCNNCTLKVGSDLMPITGLPRVGHIRMCYGCRSTVDEALTEDDA